MKSSLFQTELSKTSAIFGRKHDVNVHFAGNEAKTDGKNIILPALDMGADITEEQQAIMRGYVDHEAGHVKHTDFNATRSLGEECKASNNKLLKSVANALEDIWLERKVRGEYAGAETNLRATASAVNERFIRDFGEDAEKCQDDTFVGPVAITWEGRKDYGGESCEKCLDLVSDDLRRALPKWIDAIGHCNNTADVIALAKVVEKSLRTGDYKDDEEDTDAQGHGQGSEDADGDTSDQGRGDDQGHDEDRDGDTASEGDGEQPDADVGDERAGGRERSELRELSETPEPEEYDDHVYEDFDMSSAVTELARDGAMKGEGYRYTVADISQDQWHHRTFKTRRSRILKRAEADYYDHMLASTEGVANSMRNKLMRALVAKQQRDWDYGREDGRLDTRRLTSAFAGRTNVFKRRDDRHEIDTAMTILVDLSGSMAGRKAYLANQTAISMCEAIDRAGVAYEVLGFNNKTSFTRKEGIDAWDYTRHEPLDMYVFKQFDERLFDAKGPMGAIQDCVAGNNSDGDAIMAAGSRLLARGESRKVMLVLSDGCPAISTHDHYAVDQYTRNAVQTMSDSGIDMLGLGILDRSVEQFYPKHVVISNVHDLAGAAMDQVSRALLGERFVVDNSKLMGVA